VRSHYPHNVKQLLIIGEIAMTPQIIELTNLSPDGNRYGGSIRAIAADGTTWVYRRCGVDQGAWYQQVIDQVKQENPEVRIDPSLQQWAEKESQRLVDWRNELQSRVNARKELARKGQSIEVISDCEYQTLAGHGRDYLLFDGRTGQKVNRQHGNSNSSSSDRFHFTGTGEEWAAVQRWNAIEQLEPAL
jgi:hypothetical protein